MSSQTQTTDLYDTTMSSVFPWPNTTGGIGSYSITTAGAAGSGGYTVGNIIPATSIASSNPSWTTGTNNGYTFGDITYNTMPAKLKVEGDAEFNGDIKVKGRSLVEMLEGIEKRLGILNANPGLEQRWEKLKALGEEYRQLEKDLLEKEQIMEILKK